MLTQLHTHTQLHIHTQLESTATEAGIGNTVPENDTYKYSIVCSMGRLGDPGIFSYVSMT